MLRATNWKAQATASHGDAERGSELSQRRRELFLAYAETNDRAVRDELIFSHLGLVRQLAARFANRADTLEDINQVGVIGLIKAIDRYDPHRGIAFSSFAVPTIIGEIKRHFRDKGWAMRVPRRLKDLSLSVSRAIEALTVELGRPVTHADLARRLGVSVEEIVEAQESSRAYILSSLDAEVESNGQVNPHTLGDGVGAQDHGLNLLVEKSYLKDACATLEPRERIIIYLRFFEGVSQSEIARRLQCTQMHVSRMQHRALEKMRQAAAPQ